MAILEKAPKKKKPEALPKAPKKPLEVSWALPHLKDHYGNAECALNHKNPFELLVATILSAQCTDERVNLVTPHLFAKFPDAKAMAKAPVEQIEELIRSTGFFKNKAKNIKACAQQLVDHHSGQVPRAMDELRALPGVGRKTANVVLGVAYKIAVGVVVDTHVARLSERFLWSKASTAEKIEADLMKLLPESEWIITSHLLIYHGRRICKARNPQCRTCFLFDRCPRSGVK